MKLYPQKWEWGWNSSEVWNGRLAMLGSSAFLLELISGQGPSTPWAALIAITAYRHLTGGQFFVTTL